MSFKRVLSCSLALALVAGACTSSHHSPSSNPVASAASASPTPPPPPPRAPLTGLVVAPGSYATTHAALAVKIENTPDARPQSGLQFADIVYEEQVEGGITRFMAIFQSRGAPVLGPCRSARPEDPDILEPMHALLAYSGAAAYVVRRVRATPGVTDLSQNRAPGAYRRVGFRAAPHNLYSSTAALYRAAKSKGRRLPRPPFRFSATPPARPVAPAPSASPSGGASPAASPAASAGPARPVAVRTARGVRVDFSESTYEAVWRYAHGHYLRFEGTTPHRVDTGAQLRATNVLVIFVHTHESKHRDAAGNTTPIAEMTGSGRALLFRNGREVIGRWSRRSLAAQATYTAADGTAMALAPGTTWVELVPLGKKVTPLR